MQEVHLGHDPLVRRKSVSYLKKEMEIDYHEIEINTLFNRYGSHPSNVSDNLLSCLLPGFLTLSFQGLELEQVDKNREKYGRNELTPPKMEPMWMKFIKTLVGGFQLLLWVGSILSFAAYIAQSFQSGDPPPDNVRLVLDLCAAR